VTDKIKILLDTNFLLTMVRNKIFGLEQLKEKLPVEFYTLSRVLIELQGLGKNDKKIKREVELVNKILELNSVKVIDSLMVSVDDELVKLSKDYIIATNDKELRIKVHKNGGKTVFIRSLTYIDTSDILEE
jgi:rRNA-processing protein FCF1